MLVRDCMSAHPVTVQDGADYKIDLKLMQDHALHHIPVLDDRQKLVGIVAERDLLLAATHHMQSAVDVGDVMHRGVITTTADTPVDQAAALMVDHRIGGLPVLDAGSRVIGVITESDIFRAFVASERLSRQGARLP